MPFFMAKEFSSELSIDIKVDQPEENLKYFPALQEILLSNIFTDFVLPLLDQRVRPGGQRDQGGGEEQGSLPGASQPRRRGDLDQERSPQVPRGQQQGRPRHAGGVRLHSGQCWAAGRLNISPSENIKVQIRDQLKDSHKKHCPRWDNLIKILSLKYSLHASTPAQ